MDMGPPKMMGVEIEIEKKPLDEKGETPDGVEEGSYAETPEEAMQKAIDAGSVPDAMAALKECGYKLVKSEEKGDKEDDSDEMESEEEADDVSSMIGGGGKMQSMKMNAIKKAMRGGK